MRCVSHARRKEENQAHHDHLVHQALREPPSALRYSYIRSDIDEIIAERIWQIAPKRPT